MIHRDHSAEAAAPGGERRGRLTLYPGSLNTACGFGCATCNPSWLAGPTAIPTQDEEDESRKARDQRLTDDPAAVPILILGTMGAERVLCDGTDRPAVPPVPGPARVLTFPV